MQISLRPITTVSKWKIESKTGKWRGRRNIETKDRQTGWEVIEILSVHYQLSDSSTQWWFLSSATKYWCPRQHSPPPPNWWRTGAWQCRCWVMPHPWKLPLSTGSHSVLPRSHFYPVSLGQGEICFLRFSHSSITHNALKTAYRPDVQTSQC